MNSSNAEHDVHSRRQKADESASKPERASDFREAEHPPLHPVCLEDARKMVPTSWKVPEG